MRNNIELTYHKGKNFGDAVNPIIFKNYIKKLDLTNHESDEKLIGIGTLLGLKKAGAKKIIFSSGASQGNESIYGELPVIDETYDIICVRGPKTAKLFNLSDDLVVCDGAYLLNDFYNFDIKKTYKVSYIPHHISEKMFCGYKDFINSIGINYISP